jgi:hypothetical protein
LSAPQRALLEDARGGALEPARLGWRTRRDGARGRLHTAQTAQSLVLRRLMAVEYGLLIITKTGRDFLAQQAEAIHAA